MFQCPKITIGGVPILEQGFAWQLTAGVAPYRCHLKLSNEQAQSLKTLGLETYIDCVFYGGTAGKARKTNLRLDKIYILQFKTIDPFHQLVELADVRWGWRGKKLYGGYNKTRVMNLKGQTMTTSASDTNPASLRAQFAMFARGRYLSWSVKDPATHRPWTMKEILEDQLGKLGIPYDPDVNTDDSYVLENIILEGADIYTGIANLLRQSRLNMGIKRTGEVYIYSVDFFDENKIRRIRAVQDVGHTTPGVLWRQELSRIRPQNINISFEKKIETWVVGTTRTAELWCNDLLPLQLDISNSPFLSEEDVAARRVIGCQNVIRVPFPMAVQGTKKNIGEWVRMDDFLAAVEITEEDLRTKWFGSLLEHDYAYKFGSSPAGAGNTAEANQSMARRVCGSIRQHYRQTWQIDRFYMDRIKLWEPRLTSVINTYDHYTPPSPLFCDMCICPKVRYATQAKRTELFARSAYNWIIDTEDIYRQRPTLGTIQVVSQPLGIFQTHVVAPVNEVIKEVYPFALNPPPYSALSRGTSMLEQCDLYEKHTMETVISVVWDLGVGDNFAGEKKYHVLSTPYKGLGPDINYLSRLGFARFARPLYGCDGDRITDPSIPANLGILEALANSEAAKLYNQFRDRLVGMVTLAGLVDINLMGNLSMIQYSFSANKGLETTIDMRETPPNPELEYTLTQSAIDFLHRNISRADNVNELGGK